MDTVNSGLATLCVLHSRLLKADESVKQNKHGEIDAEKCLTGMSRLVRG